MSKRIPYRDGWSVQVVAKMYGNRPTRKSYLPIDPDGVGYPPAHPTLERAQQWIDEEIA